MTLANVARGFKPACSGWTARLVLMTDEDRLPDPLPAARRLPPGSGIVLRHYGLPSSHRLALARRLAEVARLRRLMLLVAADWRLAAMVNAAGVHLPEGLAAHGVLAPLLGWRQRRGKVLTVAAHSAAALARAARLGADAALLSPVFATASHPGAAVLGRQRFAALCRQARLPVVALGGMSLATARRLRGAGAAGCAGIGGF